MIIKEIELVLENCEVITIPCYYIGDVVVDDIKTKICRTACNAVSRFETCEVFGVEIHADANKAEYRPFGTDVGTQGPRTIFERICEYDDIASVKITLTDNEYWDPTLGEEKEEHVVFPKWVGESEYENEAQSSFLTEDNHLYIMISDRGKFDDLFGTSPYDKEERDSKFRMYDIGDENHRKYLDRYNVFAECGECPKAIWE